MIGFAHETFNELTIKTAPYQLLKSDLYRKIWNSFTSANKKPGVVAVESGKNPERVLGNEDVGCPWQYTQSCR